MLLNNDYETDLRTLLTLLPGKERLAYWHKLFNVSILEDSNDLLYVNISYITD